jgi:hypothetical protein
MPGYRILVSGAFFALALASFAHAEDKSARRLESVTWSPVDHKLTWTVTEGSVVDGRFQGNGKSTYEIRMDKALMSVKGEDRRFSKSEAVSVHALMDLVSKYAVESTVWWDAGEGDPVDPGKSNVDKPSERESPVPERKRPKKAEPGDARVIQISNVY